jgi:hypothetical protein
MSKPDDRYIPGSERAYDQVNDRLWRDIVSDRTRRGLPSVDPSSQAPPRSEPPQPAPLSAPPGLAIIDRMVNTVTEEQRLEKILELSKRVSALQAMHDARVFQLENQIREMEEALKKAQDQPDFDDLQNAIVERFGPDDKSGKKSEKKKP